MDIATAVARVQAQFDSTSSLSNEAVVRGWINECLQEALGESKWVKRAFSLGTTVADQSEYTLPADGTGDTGPTELVDLIALTVNGSKPWLRVSTSEMWELQAGAASLRGAAGAYAPNFSNLGAATVELYPTPEVAGYTIEALGAMLWVDIPDWGSGTTLLPIPDDLAGGICVDGPIGLGLSRLQEDADPTIFLARFAAAKEKLKRRANSRIGSGPHQLRVG
jgi:hypothetical protein